MINKEESLTLLRKLKLNGMASCYEATFSLAVHQQPSTHQLIAQMVQSEEGYRTNRTTQLYLRLSKLRYDSVLQNVYCNGERNFTKDNLLELSDCSFVERGENVIITGATGCGKSYLACALGRQACTMNYKTMYFGMTRLVERIIQSKIDGTFTKFLELLRKTDLIIIDDFGLVPIDQTVRLALLQILEDRYEKRAIIMASQLPLETWYDYLVQLLTDCQLQHIK